MSVNLIKASWTPGATLKSISATKAGTTSRGYLFHLPPPRARSWSAPRRKRSMVADVIKYRYPATAILCSRSTDRPRRRKADEQGDAPLGVHGLTVLCLCPATRGAF